MRYFVIAISLVFASCSSQVLYTAASYEVQAQTFEEDGDAFPDEHWRIIQVGTDELTADSVYLFTMPIRSVLEYINIHADSSLTVADGGMDSVKIGTSGVFDFGATPAQFMSVDVTEASEGNLIQGTAITYTTDGETVTGENYQANGERKVYLYTGATSGRMIIRAKIRLHR